MVKHNCISIRRYVAHDKLQLIMTLELLVPAFFAPEEVDDFAAYLDQETEDYFVAELKGKVIGAGGINYGLDGETGIISWDFVHPDYRGHGVGSALLSHRLHILQATKGIRTVTVRTSQMAYQFYERHGFCLREIQKDFWSEGYDMYFMTLDL